jgi:hypothetical protein
MPGMMPDHRVPCYVPAAIDPAHASTVRAQIALDG